MQNYSIGLGANNIECCAYCQDPLVEPNDIWQRFNQPTQKKVHALACGHKFHLSCVQEGTNEQIRLGFGQEGAATCPNCRKVIDLSSSSFKIKETLITLTKVISYASHFFAIVLPAYIATHLGVDCIFITPLVIVCSILTELILPKIFNYGLCKVLTNACIRLHNWRSGLNLTIFDLNPTELIGDKRHNAQMRKKIWIDSWQAIIANWQKTEMPIFYNLNLEISNEDQADLLNRAYAKVSADNPGTFANLQNKALQSDEWTHAFFESIEQLIELELIIPKEL
ncbi:MAG: hypothetical protein H0T62_11750 [Parachlamydiaceae bacterium]|nr:hypothetical protein [Parachlamydiaceae bacterium]